MDRRSVCGLALGTALSLSGCLGRVREPSVTGDEPTLTPGETATLSVRARSVSGLRFEDLPDDDAISIDLNDAELTPSPSTIAESYPPVWYWRVTRWSVDVSVPIRVHPETPPGEYQYAVSVTAADRISSDVTTETFSILVDGE